MMMKLLAWLTKRCFPQPCGFGKTCIVHTSNFSTLVTHKISLEWQIDVKHLEILEPLFRYHLWKFQIFTPLLVVFMDLQISKIRCVNYARFPKSGRIRCCISFLPYSYVKVVCQRQHSGKDYQKFRRMFIKEEDVETRPETVPITAY